MKILAVDTATVIASCALVEDDQLLCEMTLNHKWTHSQKLIPLVDNVLQSCETDIAEIDGFACSEGPGSFTGLRIGVATVKGFAQAMQKPVCGIPTLEALAYNLYEANGLICPIIDAQRGCVYGAAYRWNHGTLELVEDFQAIDMDALLKQLELRGEPVHFAGDACALFEEKIAASPLESWTIAPWIHRLPRAASVAALAFQRFKDGRGQNYGALTPRYIRRSQAEVEYDKKQSITLDLMKPSDLDDIMEVEKLSFQTPWSRQSMENELTNEMAFYVVARAGTRAIGYGGTWKIFKEGHITNVAVHPDFRGRGIGNAIMAELMKLYQARGIETVTLEVRPANTAALHMYQHWGFREMGRRKNYYADTGEDALIMWKEM